MAAPTIVTTTPLNNAVDVYINQVTYITFSVALSSASVNANTVLMYRSTDYSQIEGTLAYDSSTFIVSFTPNKVLDQDTTYTLIIVGLDSSTDCMKSSTLENLAATSTINFTTSTERYEAPQEEQADIIIEDDYASNATVAILETAPDIDFTISDTYPLNRATNIGALIGSGPNCTISQASGVPIPYELPVALAPGSANPSGFYTVSVKFNKDLLPSGVASYQDWIDISAEAVNGDPATTAVAPSGFVVPASGDTLYWTVFDPNSWYQNNEITVTVSSSDVVGASGSLLTNDQQFMFTTVFNPLYCTVQKIRTAIGPYIRSVPDDTINRVIYENSLLAFQLANETYGQDQWAITAPSFSAKMYACCKTQYDLLSAQLLEKSAGAGQMKRLGDFTVQDPLNTSAALEIPIQIAVSCMRFWVDRLVGETGKVHPKAVVKGVSSNVTPPMRGVRTWTKKRVGDSPGDNKRLTRGIKTPNIFSRWS